MEEEKGTEESINTIEISPSIKKSIKKVIAVIDLDDGNVTEEEDCTPLRPIFCLKKRDDDIIKMVEEMEECFILDFDPDEPIMSLDNDSDNGDSPGLSVIAEKGQVACRDYPHSRHVCANHPFKTTSHEIYCKLCYCYVCDISAPCKKWLGEGGHCHAFDNESWNHVRRATKHIGLQY